MTESDYKTFVEYVLGKGFFKKSDGVNCTFHQSF